MHQSSIEAARRNAADAGVEARVSFEVARATGYPGTNYGLICFFDCLHDMGDPIGAARHAERALAQDGTVMLIEPFANDRVEDNVSPIARLYYAASATLYCAHAIAEGGGLVLGAQAGEARLADVFRKAGLHTIPPGGSNALQPRARSAPLIVARASCRQFRLARASNATGSSNGSSRMPRALASTPSGSARLQRPRSPSLGDELGGAAMCFNVDGMDGAKLTIGAVGQQNWRSK